MPKPMPMIVLFTDFGVDGLYLGQMKAVLARQAADASIIDLLNTVPRFNVQAAAHLLAAYADAFPEDSIFLAVIDPGVGSEQRKPVAIRIGGRWFVGPDNGLFDVLVARAQQQQQVVKCWEIQWPAETLSPTFHGRDLFAPVAARLANGEPPPGICIDSLASGEDASAADLPAVIYIDHYGNIITGLRSSNIHPAAQLGLAGHTFLQARTFADVPVGQTFWYENANGLVEIAMNQGNAAQMLDVQIGDPVSIQDGATE